jgi:anhydro-N-acetylmuramic acid kinase
MSETFIGVMSGTSLDGIDAVLVRFADREGTVHPRVLAHAKRDFPEPLRADLLALNWSGTDEVRRAALAANGLAREYARLVETLLARAPVERAEVVAIGCHGQTIRHRPREFDGTGYTVQLNAPALLAELTGIDVIADFRSRDVAAGGQGAPLVPAFHRALFSRAGADVAVLNLGGIANLTVLAGDGQTTGFDCGPANALLDAWCAASTTRTFDAAGAWAATGTVDQRLLDALLDEPYFARVPPKSTGRDLFHGDWLETRLVASEARQRLRAQDIQATLAELTAQACTRALRAHGPGTSEVIVCGGGAFNDDLMARLRRALAPAAVVPSSERGLPPDQVEATAFAWLARAFVRRLPGNIPAVTGAAGPRVLGALYPAR